MPGISACSEIVDIVGIDRYPWQHELPNRWVVLSIGFGHGIILMSERKYAMLVYLEQLSKANPGQTSLLPVQAVENTKHLTNPPKVTN